MPRLVLAESPAQYKPAHKMLEPAVKLSCADEELNVVVSASISTYTMAKLLFEPTASVVVCAAPQPPDAIGHVIDVLDTKLISPLALVEKRGAKATCACVLATQTSAKAATAYLNKCIFTLTIVRNTSLD